MQSELKSLSKIFSETIFRIPDYQRGYAWNEKQLKEFWNDIEQLPDGKGHYTGVLTLEPTEKEQYSKWEDDQWIIESKSYTPLYVVDGQQRLTTSIILISCIIETIPNDTLINFDEKKDISKKYISDSKDKGVSYSYIFGYEKDNPSYEFLKQKIFGHTSNNHSTPEDTSYTKNLIFAKDFFSNKLKTLTLSEIETIFTKLTQKFLFNIFYIEKELDVFVTFETMNNRGKPLSHLELLKNRLIYLSTKFDDDNIEKSQLRKSINETWKTVYHYLGRIQNSKFDDDSFLKAHFIFHYGKQIREEESVDERKNFAIYRMMREDGDYKQYLLDKIFNPKRLSTTPSSPSSQNSKVCKYDKKIELSEVHEYIKSIKSLIEIYYKVAAPQYSDFDSATKEVLHQIDRIGSFGFFILTLVLLRNKSKKTVENLKLIERAAFLSQIRRYHFSELDHFNLTIDKESGAKSIDDIVIYIKKMIDRFSESKEIKDALRNIGKSNGYYDWAALKYFMYEYEQHLLKSTKSSRQILDWEFDNFEEYSTDYRTVEHICPQKATHPYWKEKLEKYSTSERQKIRNSIGNLLPVSQPKNSSLGNKSFDDKKGTATNQVGYFYGCLSEVQVAQSPDWGPKEILARGIVLLSFLEKRWDIPLGDIAEKIDILGLNFILEREKLSISEFQSLHLFDR